MKALGMDPVHDTRACYRRLVDAYSRPGTIQTLADVPTAADRAVLATLVDGETTLCSPDDMLCEALASQGRLDAAAVPEATVVHSQGSTDGAVTDAPRGTLKEPSRGAMVVYRISELESGTVSLDDTYEGTTVELTGPGVPDRRTLTAALPAAEFRAFADAQSTYPRGVDVVLATENRLAALPRSVDLEVA
ncbi:phosphonate C-P lyase system protein PhnH [Halobellus sp. EA9]|uniref:phosphonate C-P lyase system protein PhnH n=1 Tax=Halobellus sp. EA9 TaxID=3421647 RepID=UPI003EB87537